MATRGRKKIATVGTSIGSTRNGKKQKTTRDGECCNCTRHLSCVQISGDDACACRLARRKCVNCLCRTKCKNRSILPPTGAQQKGLDAFFCPAVSPAAHTAPSLLAARVSDVPPSGGPSTAPTPRGECSKGPTGGGAALPAIAEAEEGQDDGGEEPDTEDATAEQASAAEPQPAGTGADDGDVAPEPPGDGEPEEGEEVEAEAEVPPPAPPPPPEGGAVREGNPPAMPEGENQSRRRQEGPTPPQAGTKRAQTQRPRRKGTGRRRHPHPTRRDRQ